ncbi:MAG: bifunctional 2-polyprenyl-6-hydroxyphenol methylase/3-demethylubiquinol 3-O-methyltransferase UbiG [Pseudidiomarina maritima]|uniref:Ubiquinone biosynthesis O-methyltransferase n=1 Tax=Pseudidiomarina fusca TaxID=2965078 RepID=A0ABU3KU58_9GAMM|nr:bifunctional 2-polyprenyl-6-hydroxyphenol methylase/3-demethylubiquinol 3-O-methyltransferase UbiG [Pseudidiomarina sp. GXY010]MDT7525023.1 bifunctional 2-polyprenyl-6-hydroxyphenol methylase/3-demethylubiquinol 3-O-methyltransferase UbiG [Pseudidiomarina sp. GXY010]MDX1524993.1 bifunctional 2-polyprenyl-6-hydroxyphenol methylase/3-demethylubiquinol 3-O-methyltransferase UbiG [Pseudidiomarina maritima]
MTTSSNVDPAEIEKFSAIASRWWDPAGEFKPLHQINPLRLDFIQAACDGVFGSRIVDIGCGGGLLAEGLARAGAQVTGIDLAEQSLQVARLHALESQLQIDYQFIPAEQLAASEPGQFDVVTCLEMLEHVPNPAAIVQAAADLVKPGGKVFFSTLNRNLKSWLLGIVAAEYVLQWVPKGTHQHQKFIQPAELLRMTDAAGLVAQSMTGLHYLPWRGFYLDQNNVDVNYIVCLTKPLKD